jgi:predicted PurR-regulated permease PerM
MGGHDADLNELETTHPPHPGLPLEAGWRVLDVALILFGVFTLALVLWFAIDVLLLLFGAVLLAIALRTPADALSSRTRLPDSLALAATGVVLLLIVAGVGWLLTPQLIEQVPRLVENLSDTIRQLNRAVGLEAKAEEMAGEVDLMSALPSPAGLVGGATSLISSTFGIVANVVILVVVAIYLAAAPGLYFEGLIRLFPKPRRERAEATLSAVGHTLRWWIVGQVIAMAVVGMLSFIGLTLLGVPLALALALIAFLTNFVPFIGPIISGVPALLVAFSQGLDTALWVLLLYTAIQSFEGYVLTPMIQRESVSLPPALTIGAQVLFGVLFGVLGVIFATPLAAAGLVATRILYVEGVLGDDAGSGSTQE